MTAKACVFSGGCTMFREMRRKNQQLTEAECVEVLKNETRGVLSVAGEDGYPYGMPMNFWYDEESGHLFFHGAKRGHKVDALAKNDKVSFCVFDKGYREEGEWAWNVKSVILFGRMKPVTDPELAVKMVERLGKKYTTDYEYVEKTIRESMRNVLIQELVVEYMTGKLVNES